MTHTQLPLSHSHILNQSVSVPHSSPFPWCAGKSTALMILSGKLKPNLGKFDHPPDWQEILVNFRGSELQNFFTKLLEDNIKAIIKPQYVDSIPRNVKGKVQEIIARKDDRKVQEDVNERLELTAVLDRDIALLSGGELQRFAIAVTCVQVSTATLLPAVLSACLSLFGCTIDELTTCASLCVFVCVCVCRTPICTCSMSRVRTWM